MGHIAGRSEKIQELAHLKADGVLSGIEFQTQVTAILSGDFVANISIELPNASTTSLNQEALKRDNSSAIAGVLVIAGIAIIFLFIALGGARHKDDGAGVPRHYAAASIF